MKIVKWDQQAEINKSVQASIALCQHWIASRHAALMPTNIRPNLARLQALPANPTAEAYSAAVGADSVFRFEPPACHECGQPAPVSVVLAPDFCEDCGGAQVCLDCLRKALALGEAAQ